MEFQINYMAVVVAVVINFFLGFLWYTPLFGKAWAKEHGYDTTQKPETKSFAKGLIFMVIGNFFFAYVLAHNIEAWSFVPGIKEMSSLSNAMSSAVFTWLGFYFPTHLGATVWEKKSWKLFFIDGGYHFVALVVVSVILTYWTV